MLGVGVRGGEDELHGDGCLIGNVGGKERTGREESIVYTWKQRAAGKKKQVTVPQSGGSGKACGGRWIVNQCTFDDAPHDHLEICWPAKVGHGNRRASLRGSHCSGLHILLSS